LRDFFLEIFLQPKLEFPQPALLPTPACPHCGDAD
jgi:hypothetical protein